jgi:hypothetical protein
LMRMHQLTMFQDPFKNGVSVVIMSVRIVSVSFSAFRYCP